MERFCNTDQHVYRTDVPQDVRVAAEQTRADLGPDNDARNYPGIRKLLGFVEECAGGTVLTHAPFAGLSYQGRHEEPIPSEFAAHAASEYDDDPAPVPRMTTTDVVLLLLLWTMSVVVVVGLGAAVLPFVADFILWVRT